MQDYGVERKTNLARNVLHGVDGRPEVAIASSRTSPIVSDHAARGGGARGARESIVLSFPYSAPALRSAKEAWVE